MTTTIDSFKSRATLKIGGRSIDIYRLDALTKAKVGDVETLPYSIRVLLENLLRHEDEKTVRPSTSRANTTGAKYSRLTWWTMPVPGGTARKSLNAV